jgi:hypothetical protein
VAVVDPWSNLNSWDAERRADGVLVVRVHSQDKQGRALPDAVFTFRLGDPQYECWAERFAARYPLEPPQKAE